MAMCQIVFGGKQRLSGFRRPACGPDERERVQAHDERALLFRVLGRARGPEGSPLDEIGAPGAAR